MHAQKKKLHISRAQTVLIKAVTAKTVTARRLERSLKTSHRAVLLAYMSVQVALDFVSALTL